jgi:hypothetical protein
VQTRPALTCPAVACPTDVSAWPWSVCIPDADQLPASWLQPPCGSYGSTSQTARTKSNDDLEGMMLSSTALDSESHLGTAIALEATYNDRQPEFL